MERRQWKVVADEINQALEALGKKHDLKFRIKRWTYSDTNCDFKLNATVTKVGGKAFNADKDLFKQFASLYGLKATDYGREFKTYHGTFKVVGLKLKGRRYPIIGENVQGKRFKFPSEAVRDGFTKKEVA